MLLGSRARPVRRAENVTASCEAMSRQCETPIVSQPYRLPRPVTRIALLLLVHPDIIYLQLFTSRVVGV
jgi:hypothetical protein